MFLIDLDESCKNPISMTLQGGRCIWEASLVCIHKGLPEQLDP